MRAAGTPSVHRALELLRRRRPDGAVAEADQGADPAIGDVTASYILGMLQELSANGLIRIYTVEEKEFLAVTGWHHQRIDKPQKPLTPEPPAPHSPNGPRTFGAGIGNNFCRYTMNIQREIKISGQWKLSTMSD